MRLWTMQPLELYNKLILEKRLYSDASLSEFSECTEFRVAYQYMKEQYEEQKGKCLGSHYLWWGWYCYDGKKKAPHLNNTGFFNKGVKAVRIELEIPDEEVLLSDFDLWHIVLNDYYFDKTDNAEDEDKYYKSLSEEDRAVYNRSTWGEVFNIEGGNWVQAVFPVLRISDVVKVTHFTAR